MRWGRTKRKINTHDAGRTQLHAERLRILNYPQEYSHIERTNMRTQRTCINQPAQERKTTTKQSAIHLTTLTQHPCCLAPPPHAKHRKTKAGVGGSVVSATIKRRKTFQTTCKQCESFMHDVPPPAQPHQAWLEWQTRSCSAIHQATRIKTPSLN